MTGDTDSSPKLEQAGAAYRQLIGATNPSLQSRLQQQQTLGRRVASEAPVAYPCTPFSMINAYLVAVAALDEARPQRSFDAVCQSTGEQSQAVLVKAK